MAGIKTFSLARHTRQRYNEVVKTGVLGFIPKGK
ncbi:hypothetical protein SAMN04488121_11173 [Chitinophaga filiformis]|uniref:Uncharacterized protein n=1 Tax=Chitinophaga filiformis TaxID=104663 RepID=A0A1G8BKL7_CHIFI|nr:hypothetical protein SAMN04488121_11173 [Chitinophaga filiformis]